MASFEHLRGMAGCWFLLITLAADCGLSDEAPDEAPDGTTIVHATKQSATEDEPLPDKSLLRLGTRRFQHPGSVVQLQLSRDNKSVLTVDGGHVIAWDAATGRELWRQVRQRASGRGLSAAAYGVHLLGLHPQSNHFVTGEAGGAIGLRDANTGDMKLVKTPATGLVKSVDFSPDGRLVAVGNEAHLLVCDSDGKQLYARPNNPEAPMTFGGDDHDRLKFGGDFSYARFSPDGRLLALVNSEKPNTIQLFEAVSGDAVRDIEGADRIVRFDFSPDSTQVVATERDIAARMYDIASGERLWELMIPAAAGAESYTSAVAFRPDGMQVAVGAPIGPDNTIRLVDAGTGKETARLTGSGWKPWTLQYTSDGRLLYGSGWDGVVRRWNVHTAEQLPRPGGVRASSICAMSRDGRHLAFGDDAGDLHVVDLATSTTVKRLRHPGSSWGQVVFSHDGRKLAGGGTHDAHMHVLVWDLQSEELQHHWRWEKGNDPHSDVEALAFSGDGNRIAAAVFRQDAAYVWDLATNRQIAQVNHTGVYGMDLDHDGGTMMTAGWDKHIRVWDCDSGTEINKLEVTVGSKEAQINRDDTRMYGVKLSNDQTLIATVDMTGSIRFFDRELRPVSVISNAGWFTFGALQFSRNDCWIGVGTGDGAKVFDIGTGQQLFAADAHEQSIYTVDFGARDRTLLSGGSDGVCFLWDLTSDRKNDSATATELVRQLRSEDATEVFHAYQLLTETPERTVELLGTELRQLSETEVADGDLRKAVVGLGARIPQITERSLTQLREWDFVVHDRLTSLLADGNISEDRAKIVRTIQNISRAKTQRLVRLLTDLQTPEADELIAELLTNCRLPSLKQMLLAAQQRRAVRVSQTVSP